MLLIGTKNTGAQTVLTEGIINIGNVYRKYCKKTACSLPTFSATSNGITLNGSGMYHLTGVFVGSATTAGTITVQLLDNGEAVGGAFASETITTADTELRTLTIDSYIKVDKDCILGVSGVSPHTVAFENIGDGATFTSVTVNIEKVV